MLDLDEVGQDSEDCGAIGGSGMQMVAPGQVEGLGLDDDLILAGTSMGQDQTTYNKMMMEAGAYGKPLELKSWLQWYLALEDHEFLVEIENEFLKDKFNFINLRE